MTRPKFKTLKYNPQKWQYECDKCDYVLEHDDKRVFKLKVSFHKRKHSKEELGMNGPKWYVMQEYNDDNEPFLLFHDLAAVRKFLYKKRLIKVSDNHYKSKGHSGKWWHIQTVQGLIETDGDKALDTVNYYGYRDHEDFEKHYWSLTYTWHPWNTFDNKASGADRRLTEYANKHQDSIKVPGYDSIVVGDYWGRMYDRFHEVFAPKKVKSLQELPQ